MLLNNLQSYRIKFYPEIRQVCKLSINLLLFAGLLNLLPPAGLQKGFGVAGPSVTNVLTMAGLWEVFC